MRIIFHNSAEIQIALNNTPVKTIVQQMFKHLGSVVLPFRSWDNPFLTKTNNLPQMVDDLAKFGSKLGIIVDTVRCRQQDQNYLNQLHKVYEDNYDGNPAWLDYHEHIHMCETNRASTSLVLYHRELAGPLIKPMDLSCLSCSTLEIKAGDVYVTWAELGKTPYQYWLDRETDNQERLCILAKPWINFYPKIMVALEPRHSLEGIDQVGFQSWWQSRHDHWCNHWNIDSWTIQDMFSAIIIGTLDNVKLEKLLRENAKPVYIRLD